MPDVISAPPEQVVGSGDTHSVITVGGDDMEAEAVLQPEDEAEDRPLAPWALVGGTEQTWNNMVTMSPADEAEDTPSEPWALMGIKEEAWKKMGTVQVAGEPDEAEDTPSGPWALMGVTEETWKKTALITHSATPLVTTAVKRTTEKRDAPTVPPQGKVCCEKVR
jgi:hypothetical protein